MTRETIDDVVHGMDLVLDRYLEDDDPRGYFACVYRAVTVRILEGVNAGEFDDGPRMVRFDVLFAGYYLDAVAAQAAGRPVAASWQAALDPPRHFRVALQHLLAGMNAHINLDLGVATARAAEGDELEALRGDFARLNDVLASMVDRMQAALREVSPWSGWVDDLAGQKDEWLACWSIERARDGAWELAERLVARPDEATRTIELRDRKAALIGRRILTPSLPVRTAVALASLRERKELRRVVDVLR
jgi:hypothetical protein